MLTRSIPTRARTHTQPRFSECVWANPRRADAPCPEIKFVRLFSDIGVPLSHRAQLTLKEGGVPKVGPQNGKQKDCEGPMGKTTLLNFDPKPYCREL